MSTLLAIPAIVSFGSASIALLDVIALVLIIVALIVGLVKGFAKQILSILGFLTSLILAFVFADNLSSFISNNIPSITENLRAGIEKAIGITQENINSEEVLRETLKGTSIPAFLHEVLVNLIVESDFEIKILSTVTTWVQNIICFVFLFIIFLILSALVKFIVKRFVTLPVVKTVDRILGAIFSILKTLIALLLVIVVASTLFSLNSYLKPDGVTCCLNSVLQFISNSSLFEKFLTSLI